MRRTLIETQQPVRALRLCLVAVLLLAACGRKETPVRTKGEPVGNESSASAWAGSAACGECHAVEFASWSGSHHALAETDLDPELIQRAFGPGSSIRHGSMESVARIGESGPELLTQGVDGRRAAFPVERVFGVEPLQQFLVAFERGRIQASELAFDPARGDWFCVFSDEDRRGGEFGHWTGRGMTWNGQCAACHNTGVDKGYTFEDDTFRTTRVEQGVGCEACHGPSQSHVGWQRAHPAGGNDPHLPLVDRGLLLDSCGSCHARRAELTGDFLAGEAFLDHYLPAIPDETDIYFPDGQVRDENFEYVSFLSSRMHGEGVHCMDCHTPHGSQLRATGNALCMRCHEGKIDPAQHSHHDPDTPGGSCVDCHMPLTTYMARHPRRDHGFTIPDPQLTLDFGVPNACGRCHEDQSDEWAAEVVDEWYGERMDRSTRSRARAVAAARAGDVAAIPRLVEVAGEASALWRGVAVRMLGGFPFDARARAAVLGAAADSSPLVRSQSARMLGALRGWPDAHLALRGLLKDELRAVRVAASESLSAEIPPGAEAGRDLARSLEVASDGPAGATRLGLWYLEHGDAETAVRYLARAVEWDPYSPEIRNGYASALSAAGEKQAAAQQLEHACRLAPEVAPYAFNLGLAWSDAGDLERAAVALEDAVEIDPGFGRAWYNLGLARSALLDEEGALVALAMAERADPELSDAPYAAATIHLRLDDPERAQAAVVRALVIDPTHAGAKRLFEDLR